ncbi:MAG: GNAT family N-acetyltransferase [Bacteroidota bacterium]
MHPHITLRPTELTDLSIFFQYQLDEEGGYMAAFMPKNHTDKEAYIEKWTKLIADPTISIRTILLNGNVVGVVSKFMMHGDAEITYWIDKPFWGQGIASEGLAQFLAIEKTRPIHGHVAFDNIGSQKVLEHCGFVRIGNDYGFANAREAEIEEFIYQLP